MAEGVRETTGGPLPGDCSPDRSIPQRLSPSNTVLLVLGFQPEDLGGRQMFRPQQAVKTPAWPNLSSRLVKLDQSKGDLGEGNGNPLQYSCLENPMDGAAWRRLLRMVRKELDTTERLLLKCSAYHCNGHKQDRERISLI